MARRVAGRSGVTPMPVEELLDLRLRQERWRLLVAVLQPLLLVLVPLLLGADEVPRLLVLPAGVALLLTPVVLLLWGWTRVRLAMVRRQHRAGGPEHTVWVRVRHRGDQHRWWNPVVAEVWTDPDADRPSIVYAVDRSALAWLDAERMPVSVRGPVGRWSVFRPERGLPILAAGVEALSPPERASSRPPGTGVPSDLGVFDLAGPILVGPWVVTILPAILMAVFD